MKSGSGVYNQIANLITPKQLAVILSVSQTTIYRIIEGRKIPFYKISGSIRFKQADIDSYMASNRYEPLK